VRLLSHDTDGAEQLAVVRDGYAVDAIDLDDRLPNTMADLVSGGPAALEALRAAASGTFRGRPVTELSLLAPLPRPHSVIAIGRNYRGHADEEGAEYPNEPPIFSKLASSVVGPGAAICWDETLTRQVDWEAELAVVIGRRARHVSVQEALDHVLGYMCLNDVSARDLQFGDAQWTRGKSLDTFCPTGPQLVTADEVPDPQALDIRCLVNGKVMQDSSTASMIFSVAEIVSHCSQAFTLEPGTVIATGTPDGVGVFREPPILLADGDEVVVEIDGVGRLVNTCVARSGDVAAADG
jgi:2-keto-4-pentenoate hydratase/2-oxohepta-3-ene-1,7-dioic acid hydratase in catechol pathway